MVATSVAASAASDSDLAASAGAELTGHDGAETPENTSEADGRYSLEHPLTAKLASDGELLTKKAKKRGKSYKKDNRVKVEFVMDAAAAESIPGELAAEALVLQNLSGEEISEVKLEAVFKPSNF